MLFIHLSKGIMGSHILDNYIYLRGEFQGLWIRTFIVGKASWRTENSL